MHGGQLTGFDQSANGSKADDVTFLFGAFHGLTDKAFSWKGGPPSLSPEGTGLAAVSPYPVPRAARLGRGCKLERADPQVLAQRERDCSV